jgi:hypothetical protein
MKLGDVDGKDCVYDGDGEAILLEDEIPYDRLENVYLDLSKTWRGWLVDSIIRGEDGKFMCTLTDQRILFIRRPDLRKAGSSLMTPLGAPTGVALKSRARHILQRGGFEYCEFVTAEIKFYERIRVGVQLYFMASGKKYNATVGTKRAPTLIRWLTRNGIPVR